MQNPLLSRLLTLAANGMAGFMDLAVGMLIVASLGTLFSLEITFYHLLIGGFFALFPDMDIVGDVIKGKAPESDHHLTLFHRPLVVLPTLALLTFLFVGSEWAVIVFSCVFWHYLHDTKWQSGLGGIAWFWPFTPQYWSPMHGFEPPREYTAHHDHLKKYWLVPSSLSLFELSIGLGALYGALSYSGFAGTAILLTGLSALVFGTVWVLYPLSALKRVTEV